MGQLTDTEIAVTAALQASLMTETVTVVALGEPEWSGTDQATIPAETTIYTGPARVAIIAPGAPTLSPSGEIVTPTGVAVTVPHDAPTLPVDARAHVDGSTMPGHPLVGSDVWISDETTGHLPTARRYTARRVR